MIVMKFGGTSNQDAAAMKNVAGIVASRRVHKPIVVISAIARGTNMLEQAGKLAAEGRLEEAHATLRALFDRHYAILAANVTAGDDHAAVKAFLDQSLAALEELSRGVAILRELTPRTLDAFYCYGELMSSRLVWGTMRSAGVQAEWLDTKDFMITDGNFTAAAPFMDMVAERLQRLVYPGIDNGTVYVTQGFIGVTERGDRTTMGRESSDYSAAVIGAALDVKDVQIWTDVDGILTGDPTVIAKPKKVREMTFQEAYDVSFFGAKVLHPSTMLPALQKNIPIHIYNSRRPHLSGSAVTGSGTATRHIVKSVASRNRIAVIMVEPVRRLGQFIFWEHIFSILNRHGISTRLTATSEYGLAIALDDKYNLDAVRHDLEPLGTVRLERGKGIIALVGSRMGDDPQLLSRVFARTGRTGVEMISFGPSSSSLSFVVPEDSLAGLVQALHSEFFDAVVDPQTFEELE